MLDISLLFLAGDESKYLTSLVNMTRVSVLVSLYIYLIVLSNWVTSKQTNYSRKSLMIGFEVTAEQREKISEKCQLTLTLKETATCTREVTKMFKKRWRKKQRKKLEKKLKKKQVKLALNNCGTDECQESVQAEFVKFKEMRRLFKDKLRDAKESRRVDKFICGLLAEQKDRMVCLKLAYKAYKIVKGQAKKETTVIS